MNDVWPIVFGALATVAGVLITNLTHYLNARGQRRHTDRREYRTAAMNAATSLLVALDDHRTSMVTVNEATLDAASLHAATSLLTALDAHRTSMVTANEATLSGAPQDKAEQARARVHETRAAITRPLVEVKILLPEVADLADRAVAAVFAMRRAPDAETLEARRLAAKQAAGDLAAEVTDVLRRHLGTGTRR